LTTKDEGLITQCDRWSKGDANANGISHKTNERLLLVCQHPLQGIYWLQSCFPQCYKIGILLQSHFEASPIQLGTNRHILCQVVLVWRLKQQLLHCSLQECPRFHMKRHCLPITEHETRKQFGSVWKAIMHLKVLLLMFAYVCLSMYGTP